MTTWIEGIDAAWSRPTPAQLTAAGKRFIIGYVSHDPAKNLSADECAAYLAADIGVGLVWETTTDRALSGAAGGSVDGPEARRQARALGFPDDRPIFTAVDFQATAVQLAGPVGRYLKAFAAGVGGPGLAGVYGGLGTVTYALDAHLVAWGWQTYAWSHGQWDARAQVQQYSNGVHIAGHDTDLDRALDLSPFWTKETDMTALTPADADMVWNSLQIPDMRTGGKPLVSAGTALAQAWGTALAVKEQVAALAVSLADLPAAVVAALPPSVTGALSAEDLAAIGTVVHDQLGKLSIAVAP